MTLRAGLIVAALVAALGAAYWTAHALVDVGYQKRIAEEAAHLQEKGDAVQKADEANRRCTVDPACRVRDDGFRRD